MGLPYLEKIRENARHPAPWIILAVVTGMSIWIRIALGPLRWEHWVSNALLLLPAWLGGARGRAWSRTALPFWLAGILYVNFKLLEPYRLNPVHVADLYGMEHRWFGVGSGTGRITLAEWFSVHNHAVIDLFTGLAYILYLYQPFVVFTFFFFTRPARAQRLARSFLLVNVLGMATYLLYPAAPPWYVMEYGFGPIPEGVVASTAGAARFDALTGLAYFEHFYARSADVFGAVPSLHAAFPLVVFLTARGMGAAWSAWTLGFALLVGFSAVYLQHHYLIDVLVGYAYAGMAVGSIVWMEKQRKR